MMTTTNFDKKAHEEWKRNAFAVLNRMSGTAERILDNQNYGPSNIEVLKEDVKDTAKEVANNIASVLTNVFETAYQQVKNNDNESGNAIAEDEANFIDVDAKIETVEEDSNITEEKEEIPVPKVNITIQDADSIKADKPKEAESTKVVEDKKESKKQEVNKVTPNKENTAMVVADRKEEASNTDTHKEDNAESGTAEPVYEFNPNEADSECEALRHLEFAKGKFNFKRQFVDHMAATEELVEASRNLVTAWAGTLGYPMIDTSKTYGSGEEEWTPYVERATFLLKNGQINQDEYELLVRRISRQPRWEFFSMLPELNGMDALFDKYFYNKYEWSQDLQKIVAAMNSHTEKRYGLKNKKNRGDTVAKPNVGISQNANNSGTFANADANPQQSSNVPNFMNPLVNAMSNPQPVNYSNAMNSVNPYMAMMNPMPQQMVPQGAFNSQMMPQQPMANPQMRPSNAYPQGYEMVPFE